MTDRPLEVAEMALRTKFQLIWNLIVGVGLILAGMPVLEWGWAGFNGFPFSESWETAGRLVAALFGPLQILGGLRLYFFVYLPYKIARKQNAGSSDIRRR